MLKTLCLLGRLLRGTGVPCQGAGREDLLGTGGATGGGGVGGGFLQRTHL